ncbi:ABC transporter permease [Traorella massiliensis]|uniref:ABC transporter permease n=1 Tax=Traorella massiliensis TaxID=1903263 RepID=UPI0008F7FCC0|nr:ABC transporter permease [Traorella massiliensis]
MKRYFLGRLIRSIFSIFIVVIIAIVMIFGLIPKEKVFENDPQLSKLSGKPDDRTTYIYTRWEELGYLDYVTQADMCKAYSDDYNECMRLDVTQETNETGKVVDVYSNSEEGQKVIKIYEEQGYTVDYMTTGFAWASRDNSIFNIAVKYITNMFKVDNPWAVTDPDNPDMDRSIYFGTDNNGMPALKCSGCEHQYLIYVDGSFPFIHQNWISLNFGRSYPTYSGSYTMDVISDQQGEYVQKEVTFDNGTTAMSSLDLHSCQYKQTSTLDRMDKSRFETNYANCKSFKSEASMINMSYIFGIISLIIAYIIAIPSGIIMAQKKDKWQDKLGMVYINVMIAVPSLAFIYFARNIGIMFNQPTKFPTYGGGDIRSYILPGIILALLSTASLMIWMRRYMVDQSNADYVKFARAKGLSQGEIFRRHILKNAIIPIVNGIPSSIILCIGGSVITESVFSIPGMGKMLPDAINANNNAMIITLTFIFTALSIIALLLGDVLMTFVDPRIQLSSKGETR